MTSNAVLKCPVQLQHVDGEFSFSRHVVHVEMSFGMMVALMNHLRSLKLRLSECSGQHERGRGGGHGCAGVMVAWNLQKWLGRSSQCDC